MKTEPVAAKRSKTHTRYYNKAGTLLPGVTTILGLLNKPALVPWANGLGLQGINVREYVDALALIGTIGHQMICDHNRGVPFQTNGHPAELIDKAENCFLSYLAWEKQHKVEPILCEAQLISELHGYGGTVDMYAKVDGVPTIVDYKTGKAIYPEHIYQVAAYRQLLEENGHFVADVRILQIGRDETEGFSEKVVTTTTLQWMIFEHLLETYKLQKKEKAA
jgi:hypothetical protein